MSYQDPRDVYIALRPDGPDGNGSIDNPYDGSVVSEAVTVAENGITLVPDRAVAVLGVGHTYQVGQTIRIAGITWPAAPYFNSSAGFSIVAVTANGVVVQLGSVPPSPVQPYWNDVIEDGNGTSIRLFWPVVKVTTAANHSLAPFEVIRLEGLSDAALNGEFVIVASPYDPDATPPVAGDWFYFLLNDVPGSTSGTPACARRVYRFDQRMHAALPYSRLNLGPGTFETRGMANMYVKRQYPEWDQVFTGFTVKPGQKIRGSGIDVTVLKVAFAVDRYANTSALASYLPVDYFEVSDLTVDCNLGGQPVPAGMGMAPVTCAAVWVSGQHNRVRRMRAINFGDQAWPECFVVLLNGHFTVPEGAMDNVIEDCIVEKPGENNTHETSSLACASPDHVTANNRGSVVRHNYLNFEYSNGSGNHPVAVTSIYRDATDHTLAHLTSAERHGHIASKALDVRGVLVGGSANDAFNGVFRIERIVSDTALDYRLNADPGVSAADVNTGAIGFGRSNERLSTSEVELLATDRRKIRFKTRRAHAFLVGNHVQVIVRGYVTAGGETRAVALVGAYPVEAVQSATEFRCLLPDYPEQILNEPNWTPYFSNPSSIVGGASFHGPTAAGTNCVSEGNAVYDCEISYYVDTGTVRSTLVRNNYYSNVLRGVYFNFPEGGGNREPYRASLTGVSLTRTDLGNGTARAEFTASGAHRLSVGQAVKVEGARIEPVGSPPDPSAQYYNGVFPVESVTSNGFTYITKGVPSQNASDPTTEKPLNFAAMYQVNHLVAENNVFDGYSTTQDSWAAPVGLSSIGYDGVPPYIFPQMVFRENLCRHIDNGSDAMTDGGGYGIAVRITSTENAIIESNLIGFGSPHLLHDLWSRNITAFHNLGPTGNPIPAEEDLGNNQWRAHDDLRSRIEDAHLMAL